MNVPVRTASLIAGIALALMAVIAPLGVMLALPAGHYGLAAMAVLCCVALDVIAATGLFFVLRVEHPLTAAVTAALRLVYSAVFSSAAGALLGDADPEQFQAVWDAGLFLFGVHLVLVGAMLIRETVKRVWIGVLVVIAGAGYLADTIVVALDPTVVFSFGQFAFVGEVVLLVWLIGWSGRHAERSVATS